MRIKLLEVGHKYRVFPRCSSIVGWMSDGRPAEQRAPEYLASFLPRDIECRGQVIRDAALEGTART
jgi:hypothetical protein